MINYDLKKIRALAFDVDGVLSTNLVTLLEGVAQPARTANIKDGYALQHAVKCGFTMAIITGGKSEAVRVRYEGLGMKDVMLGISHKLEAFERWREKHGLAREEILYMGDDIPDLPVLRACGLPCCPADAAPEVREACLYVSPQLGGNGCVRDVLEQVLRAHGQWNNSDEAFGW